MKLFLLGDSTCADKTPEARPETGWGECIQEYLADGWVVDNRAINGLSTKDMIAKGLFQAIVDDASEGDAALIQFGHNDSKSEDPVRYSAPWTQFIANLVYMADKLREKNVSTVFLTPIARRRFKDGIIVDTHGDYPAAMKAAAHQAGCPCIDLTIPTMVWLQKEGPEDFPGPVGGLSSRAELVRNWIASIPDNLPEMFRICISFRVHHEYERVSVELHLLPYILSSLVCHD